MENVSDEGYGAELALVLPVYNEGDVLVENIKKIDKYFSGLSIDYVIICVDDCSMSKTKNILVGIANDNPRVCLCTNSVNQGKGKSVKAGIEIAKAEYVIFTDSDLAYTLDSIFNVYSHLKDDKADIVFANRRHKNTRFIIDCTMFKYVYKRHRISGVFNGIVKILFGIDSEDTQSGLKGFKLSSANIIFNELSVYNFAFDVEIFILAKKHDINWYGLPCVVRYPHEVSTVKLVADSIDMLQTLLKLWLKYSRRIYAKK